MLKKMIQGCVEHEVKVTHLKGVGYGVRVLVNGEVNQQAVAPTRADIESIAKSMLRMEDKCGNDSDYAYSARHRNKPKNRRAP